MIKYLENLLQELILLRKELEKLNKYIETIFRINKDG